MVSGARGSEIQPCPGLRTYRFPVCGSVAQVSARSGVVKDGDGYRACLRKRSLWFSEWWVGFNRISDDDGCGRVDSLISSL